MTLTLHYLVNSRAQRILWMLEELGLPYEVEVYPRDPKTNLAPEALKAVHPLGKSPVITDGSVVVAESGAIIEYLAQTHAPETMIPSDPEALRQYRYWMHYAEGSLMPLLVTSYIFRVAGGKVPVLARPVLMAVPKAMVKAYYGPTLKTHMDFVEGYLGERTWFAGEAISGADIQMSFPLETSAGRVEGDYPNIRAYVARVHARPAYQRALKAVGVDYAYA